MSTLAWMVLAGIGMSLIALVGGITTVLPRTTLERIILPMVGLAAGSLLGGAMLHLIPESVEALGNTTGVYLAVLIGFGVFFVLEQFLHWHHCHRTEHDAHQPLGYLILIADGLHNLIGGLAVGGAFIVDLRVGAIAWLVAAAHEIPQELGDFGVLVHGGWPPRSALLWNLGSALTFLLGVLVAYAMASHVQVAYLLPFAAGNFIYVAAADLLPELTHDPQPRAKVLTSVSFLVGVSLLALATLLT